MMKSTEFHELKKERLPFLAEVYLCYVFISMNFDGSLSHIIYHKASFGGNLKPKLIYSAILLRIIFDII